MDCTSVAAISAGRCPLPECVSLRAEELLDGAIMRFVATCLGVTVALQILALAIGMIIPPMVHYIPEIR